MLIAESFSVFFSILLTLYPIHYRCYEGLIANSDIWFDFVTEGIQETVIPQAACKHHVVYLQPTWHSVDV